MTEARAVSEWVGRDPDTPIPLRVKLRICARQNGLCASCNRAFDATLRPEFDHNPALINGGANRESLINAICRPCHRLRTNTDVAEKSRTNRIKAKHLGLVKSKRPFPQRRDPWNKEWRARQAEKA